MEEHYRKLERMYLTAPVNRYYAPTVRIGQGKAKVVIPVRPDFFHAAGAVHGSVYFKAMDDAAYFAANSLVMDCIVLTASFEVRLFKPITEGEITALARVVQSGERDFLAEARLYDDAEEEAARGVGRFVRSSIPLSNHIGYE